jgi:hypothetical protein
MTAVEASVDSLETAVGNIAEASGDITAITTISNDSLTLGRSDQQDMLDFSTDDRINFKVDNVERFAITNNNRVARCHRCFWRRRRIRWRYGTLLVS